MRLVRLAAPASHLRGAREPTNGVLGHAVMARGRVVNGDVSRETCAQV